MLTRPRLLLPLAVLLLLSAPGPRADEGMYPISDLASLDLRSKGLLIAAADLYNPAGASLVDAIVSVGGCTGSFVSPDGLIITNHHCAFGAAQAASTAAHDYVTDGFLARTRAEELSASGLTVRITESYRDVSADVLADVTETMDPAARTKAIDRRSRQMVAEAERAQPGKQAEVSQMAAGRSYVLFVYATYRDVRLVYVPPRAIGEFGGENDNWMWPRHTGDFSFLRAYVGADGKPAEFAPANVPVSPRRFLRVQPSGADEHDAVFILGYPGRTFRHRTSHYLQYEQSYTLPIVSAFYDWQIATMQELSSRDRAVSLKFDARIKSLSNTTKNYKGKLQGLRRLDLVARKRQEEARLQAFIDADPARTARYGTVLRDIAAVYDEMSRVAPRTFVLTFLGQGSPLLQAANTVWAAGAERAKPDVERSAPYTDRSVDQTREQGVRALAAYEPAVDRALLAGILARAAALPPDQRLASLDAFVTAQGGRDAFLERAYAAATVTTPAAFRAAFGQPVDALAARNDPMLALARVVYEAQQERRDATDRQEGTVSRLMAHYAAAKEQFEPAAFVPDANRTLRFTVGRVKGYSPADAAFYSPITTLAGVVEKTTGEPPYHDTPARVLALAKQRDFGRWAHARLNDVPVAILYDADTTGGNSGSPVLNARGELVGVNFDRTWEATINDYAWSESYSRSIGVDIRYVLWITEKVAGAEFLLKEMGLEGF